MSFVETFFQSLSIENITEFFFWLLAMVMLSGLSAFIFSRYKPQSRFAHFADYAPVLLTSLGILGTFSGIVVGLLNFNIVHIDSSISSLLEGMKTAFLTSVMGVSFSIFLKISYTIIGKSKKELDQDLDIEKLVSTIYRQAEENQKQTVYLDKLVLSAEAQKKNQEKYLNHSILIAKLLTDKTNKGLLGVMNQLCKECEINRNEMIKMNSNIESQYVEIKKQNEFLKTLSGFTEEHKIMQQKMLSGLALIVRFLGSNSENSLLAQIKNLYHDMNSNHEAVLVKQSEVAELLQKIMHSISDNHHDFNEFDKKLSYKLDDFAEMMSKSATETVIEALKQVIVEFNQNLMSQFGDNFKELNNAVMLLVQWQENYKKQLDEMIVLYSMSTKSLDVTEKSVAIIANESQVIPQHMEKLGEVIKVNQRQIDNLNTYLTSFAELRDKAVEAIPEVSAQVEIMLANVEDANLSVSNALKESALSFKDKTIEINEQLKKEIGKVINDFSENSSLANHSVKEISENVRNISQYFSHSIEEIITKQIEENNRLLHSLQEEGNRTVKSVGELVNQELKMIDDSMQRELERVLQEMGSALATISRQFTNDYSKLVEAMSNIVQRNIL